MQDESPLIQALKSKSQSGGVLSSPEDLLTFILTHFDLTPKENEVDSKDKPMNVQTQESHAP